MGKKLAIQGHEQRGDDVINILKMLGGTNYIAAFGNNDGTYYFINEEGIIDYDCTLDEDNNYLVFSLEEFLEKYPFKVRDKVFDIADGDPGIIKDMKWDEDVSDMKYRVAFDNGDMGWYTNDTIESLKLEEGKTMIKKLAIKGHATRGKEVIELLEMMGGITFNSCMKIAYSNRVYYIGNNNAITWDYIGPDEIDKYEIFTLEEFLEKYPFKVGDNVLIPEYESEVRICKMQWDGFEIQYMVYRNDDQEWYSAEELLNYNAEFLVYKEKSDEVDGMLHDMTLNRLYELGMKKMFKKHDIVVVESHDKRQKWICEYKSYENNQLYYYKGTYDIYSNKEELMYESSYDVTPSDIIRLAYYDEIGKFERMIEKNNTTNHMPNVLAELLEHIKTTSKEELEKEFNELEEWSYVGPTVEEFMDFCNKVNKKPKYPTTYVECCKVMSISYRAQLSYTNPDVERGNIYLTKEKYLLDTFIKLRICRNAYWKIAGEKMGLGKPWEPDWTSGKPFYCISVNGNIIGKGKWYTDSKILAFPTEEMLDTFYENFKDLIEQCKELL